MIDIMMHDVTSISIMTYARVVRKGCRTRTRARTLQMRTGCARARAWRDR